MFETFWTKDKSPVFNEPGDRFHATMKLTIDENGVKDLKESGKVDTFMEIQSHKDSVDIHTILQRYASGDVAALNAREGMYGDFTSIPDNINDLNNKLLDAEQFFATLPATEREKFNNSASQFFASVGTPMFEKWSHEFFNDGASLDVHVPVDDISVSTGKDDKIIKEVIADE